jgi:hypothetical protein
MHRLALCLLLLTGCGFDLDLDGDESPGEEGRSTWQIDDGLCPGFGGCDLEVPLAAGAHTTLDITVPDRNPAAIELSTEGPIRVDEVVERDVENERLRVDVSATGAGEGVVHLLEGDEELDRARVQIAESASMTCGVAPLDAAVLYDLEGLDLEASGVTLSLPTDGSSADERDLACRLEDADGTPLLSVRLVEWEVIEGTEVVRVDAEPFESDPSGSVGARVSVQPLATGSATVVARWEGVERAFDVVVE